MGPKIASMFSMGNEGKFVANVARALAILEALDSSRRGLNISEISRKLKIPKSSAHVIVLTLEKLDYIQKPPGTRRYSLGLKAYGLGQAMLKSFLLADKALPHMQALVDKVDLTCHLAVRDKEQALCVQKVENKGMIKFDTNVGRHMDLHCTALGKAIMAFEDDEVLRDYLSKEAFMRHTRYTIVSSRALRQELITTRKRGYAIDDQEEELEVRCVAAPVFDQYGKLAAALSLTGTVGQLPLEKAASLAEALRETAASIRGARP